MVWIFQPDRYLLYHQIKLYGNYINGIVLDVGSGPIYRYKHLFTNVETYITLDIERDFRPDIVGDATFLPIKNEALDGIVCTQVLEHIKNPFTAVAEFSRVLKKHGTCLITVPQTNELHEEPNDFYRFTKYALYWLASNRKKGGLE